MAERLGIQRTDRAQVDHVARELVVHALLDPGADLHPLAATRRAEFLDAGDFGRETHAARAVDAARHVGRDERSQVLVLDDALALVESRLRTAEAEREVLEFALAALVADRAVERMIDQQEFHRRLLRRHRPRRTGEDLHAFRDRRRAGRHRLRRLLHFDQAHAAVRRDGELLVIAEAWNVNSCCIGQLHDHLALARLQRPAVDFDVDDVVAHATACAGPSTTLLPPCSTMYSNSWRKCLRKLCTGQAAASPSAQIV